VKSSHECNDFSGSISAGKLSIGYTTRGLLNSAQLHVVSYFFHKAIVLT
jgi:hypothetical protein